MNVVLKSIYEGVLNGNAPQVQEGVVFAIDQGYEPGIILSEGMIAVMAEVGKRFEEEIILYPRC